MAAAHWVIFNGKSEPVKCVVGKKAEKAQVEITKIDGYSMREVPKDRCPYCNPKPKEETGQDPEREAEPVTLHEAGPEPTKPGYCGGCGSSTFKLKFIDHVMVRVCNVCGIVINLTTMKEWGE